MSVLMEEPKSRAFTPEDLLQLPGHGKEFFQLPSDPIPTT